ncbi:TPA: hypothetical protein QDB06_001703 [Burkholderia vietnamiensis]|uniref:hypothetical protein n=1 Tax=Burkholderia cepacia complex TaxID=87882 RepID=UPI0019082005|nr:MULTISPECIES: hypothetical protein [Burkholderia cepacia complex]MBJ9698495.1 hypothetical protein [Burkholderia cenocepacia]MBR8215568.1 hypothetical protein [Burkholderia vietnamiensis]HDR9181152.1 hypothetical protein [Burkholderia vietnamiensis]
MSKPTTNLECVTEIMTFSRYGALAQAFVMDALSQHAARVATTPLDQLQVNPMISSRAWQGVAREIHDKLEAHFSR